MSAQAQALLARYIHACNEAALAAARLSEAMREVQAWWATLPLDVRREIQGKQGIPWHERDLV